IVWGVKRGLRIEGSWTGARGARPGLWSIGGPVDPQTTAVRRKEPERSERSATDPARIAANDCTLPTEVDTDGDSHLRDDGRGLGGAHPLRPPPRGAPRPHQGPARGFRPR